MLTLSTSSGNPLTANDLCFCYSFCIFVICTVIPLVPHWCNSSTLHSFVLFFVLLLTIPASIWCTGGSFNCSSEWGTRTEASVLTLNLRCSRKVALSMPWTVSEILSLPFIFVFSQTISFYVSFASFARVPLAPIPPRSNPFEWLKRMMASHDLNAFEGACYLRFYYILGQMLLHMWPSTGL